MGLITENNSVNVIIILNLSPLIFFFFNDLVPLFICGIASPIYQTESPGTWGRSWTRKKIQYRKCYSN